MSICLKLTAAITWYDYYQSIFAAFILRVLLRLLESAGGTESDFARYRPLTGSHFATWCMVVALVAFEVCESPTYNICHFSTTWFQRLAG